MSWRTELHSGFKELRTALHGQRKEHDRHRRRVERQLAALVLGHAVTDAQRPLRSDDNGTDESGGSGTSSGPPWWRPGEAVQRKVEDLIYEWRQARNWFLAAEECLGIALDWDMVADLAVRDESADAPAERRTARSRQLSKRSLAPSQQVEQDMVEAG